MLPYSEKDGKEPQQKTGSAPVITVFFSTPTDLEAFGRRMQIHHLYYSVSACASDPLEDALCDGEVYRANEAEAERLLGSEDAGKVHVYKVHIPNSLQIIGKCGEGIGDLNVPEELKKVRSSGMCMIVGGGNMLASGFWSSGLRVPVSVHDDSFEIDHGK